MHLLFSMSLAGSLVFLFYLCIRPATLRYFPAVWRYRFLKVTLLFYLVPYQYYKPKYLEVLRKIFPSLHRKLNEKPVDPVWDMSKFILIDAKGHWHFKNQMFYLAAAAAWIMVVGGFIFIRLKKYLQCKKAIQKITVPASISYKKTNRTHKIPYLYIQNIRIYSGSYIKSPFVIGFFSPRIILPDSLAESSCLDMVLSHELTHIRNHDALVKLLGTAAILLHWYNPLTYFLYWEICRTCEHVCDEMAVAGRNPQEKEDYQMLLLKAGSEDKSRSLLTNTLSSEFKLLKERIIVMDSEIDNDTVLIYSPVPWDSLPDFVYNDDPFLSSDTTDDIFIDAEGNSYVLPDATAQSLSCAHQWKDGIIYKHLSNGAGGCSVYSYNAQICTQCNMYENEILSNILQYLVCPHGGI